MKSKLLVLAIVAIALISFMGCAPVVDPTPLPLPELTAQEQWDLQASNPTIRNWIISRMSDLGTKLSVPIPLPDASSETDKLFAGAPDANLIKIEYSVNNYYVRVNTVPVSVIAFSWSPGSTILSPIVADGSPSVVTLEPINNGGNEWNAVVGQTVYIPTLASSFQNLSGL